MATEAPLKRLPLAPRGGDAPCHEAGLRVWEGGRWRSRGRAGDGPVRVRPARPQAGVLSMDGGSAAAASSAGRATWPLVLQVATYLHNGRA